MDWEDSRAGVAQCGFWANGNGPQQVRSFSTASVSGPPSNLHTCRQIRRRVWFVGQEYGIAEKVVKADKSSVSADL